MARRGTQGRTFTERYPADPLEHSPIPGSGPGRIIGVQDVLGLEDLRELEAEAAKPQERLPIQLVPVVVTETDEYGLQDAVSPREPCRWAAGHIYRFSACTEPREPGDALTIWVDPTEYAWFSARCWQDEPCHGQSGSLVDGVLKRNGELEREVMSLKQQVTGLQAIEEKYEIQVEELRQIAVLRQTEARMREMTIAELKADRDSADELLRTGRFMIRRGPERRGGHLAYFGPPWSGWIERSRYDRRKT